MCSVEHIFDNAELRAGPPRRSRMTLSAGDDDVMDNGPLERLRRICLALPETTERLSHGEPNWFVRGKKTFVSYAERHEQFFVPPHVGVRGWIGVYLDVPVDWQVAAELVEEAYREVAPGKLVAELDAAR